MLCTWQVRALANTDAEDQRVTKGNGVTALLNACNNECAFLRIGYIRVVLPVTITTWRLDLVYANSDETQGVILLADSTSTTLVAEPRIGLPDQQWWADRVFPGRPCLSTFNQAALRLLSSPLPVADWSATIDLDIYQPNPSIEPCQP